MPPYQDGLGIAAHNLDQFIQDQERNLKDLCELLREVDRKTVGLREAHNFRVARVVLDGTQSAFLEDLKRYQHELRRMRHSNKLLYDQEGNV